MRKWTNTEGWSLTLSERLALTLFYNNQPCFFHQYEWWQKDRAEREAGAMATLGKMEVAHVA